MLLRLSPSLPGASHLPASFRASEQDDNITPAVKGSASQDITHFGGFWLLLGKQIEADLAVDSAP